MKLSESVATCLKKYINFSGRAMRSEYWWFIFAMICVNIMFGILLVIIGAPDTIVNIVSGLVGAGFFFPLLSVSARRLHDVGRSGWWYLLILTGFGSLLLIYWYLQPSDNGDNEYGEQP